MDLWAGNRWFFFASTHMGLESIFYRLVSIGRKCYSPFIFIGRTTGTKNRTALSNNEVPQGTTVQDRKIFLISSPTTYTPVKAFL